MVFMGKVLLFLILNLLLLASFASGATVHGTIYDSNLDTVNKVVVEVNSTPLQRHVSKYGGYSFELDPGTYHIVALTSHGEEANVVSEEYFTVSSREGDYIVDLFIFPGINITTEGDVNSGNSLFTLELVLWLVSSLLLIALGFFILLFFKNFFGREDNKNSATNVEYNIQYSSADLEADSTVEELPETKTKVSVSSPDENEGLKKRILNLIDENNGEMSQKDIRKKIKLSESKISEVITQLVKDKKLEKVKKGRSNLIVKK